MKREEKEYLSRTNKFSPLGTYMSQMVCGNRREQEKFLLSYYSIP
jgi:hypothetical protein